MIGIVISQSDPASTLIGQQLLDLVEWTPTADSESAFETTDYQLRFFEPLHLELETVASEFDDPSCVIFASRHSGESGPILTAHFTGNFGPASHGGQDRELSLTCPNIQSRLVDAFDRFSPDGYAVGIECTHHGPTRIGCPSVFAEIGSGPDQWADETAARAVARAILDVSSVEPHADRHIVGFGGGHYAPRFERILRTTSWRVGHIAASWGVDELGDPEERRDLIDEMFEKSRSNFAVIDGDYPAIERVISSLGYRTVSERWIRAVSAVPLDTVETIEETLGPIEVDTKIGDQANGFSGDFEFVSIPQQLIDLAYRIDRSIVTETFRHQCIAYRIEDSGDRPIGRVAISNHGDRTAIIDVLLAVIRREHDVEQTDDEVVVRERVFDPERARTLGIPEGPAFGRLSRDESIVVDGREIGPDDVHSIRTHRMTLKNH